MSRSPQSHILRQLTTLVAHPEIKRDSRFAELNADHVKYFKEVVGTDSAVIDSISSDTPHDLEAFNTD